MFICQCISIVLIDLHLCKHTYVNIITVPSIWSYLNVFRSACLRRNIPSTRGYCLSCSEKQILHFHSDPFKWSFNLDLMQWWMYKYIWEQRTETGRNGKKRSDWSGNKDRDMDEKRIGENGRGKQNVKWKMSWWGSYQRQIEIFSFLPKRKKF